MPTPITFHAWTRSQTRAAFFAEVAQPTGRDLARLDLTAAALDVLDALLSALPEGQRPSRDGQARLALDSAAAFVESVHSPGKPEPRRLAIRLARLFTAQGVPEALGKELGEALLDGLVRFTEQHCFVCPAACLTRPDQRMESDFFADEHPAGIP